MKFISVCLAVFMGSVHVKHAAACVLSRTLGSAAVSRVLSGTAAIHPLLTSLCRPAW
jgi:hypothetical protein